MQSVPDPEPADETPATTRQRSLIPPSLAITITLLTGMALVVTDTVTARQLLLALWEIFAALTIDVLIAVLISRRLRR